jgi:hypothetical protein
VLRCASPCLEGNVCPPGFTCGRGWCIRGGGFFSGERCRGPTECRNNLCALFANQPSNNYCTKPCESDDDCGAGFSCRDELGAWHCVPAVRRMGEECVADTDCTTRRCAAELGRCTRACDPTSEPCPAGFRCEIVNAELLCIPSLNAFPGPTEGGSDASGRGGASGAPPVAGVGGTETAVGDSDGGCGCRAASHRSSGSPTALFVVLVALCLTSRRARQKTCC